MLDEKWIKKVEKNIRREIKIDIDNNEFIEEIFGNYIDKNNNVLITCLDDVKSKIWPVQPWWIFLTISAGFSQISVNVS